MPNRLWLIPKRANLHQSICLIGSIIDRGYDGSTWSPTHQNNLGATLNNNYGATRFGRNVQNQSIRTLFASIPQYMGFAYIDNSGESSVIRLTEAGYKLWNQHKNEIVKIEKLSEGRQTETLIEESEVYLKQFEKLQITNPIIVKDCIDIFVFPFRFALSLMRKMEYLDREEIGYILFQTYDESQLQVKYEEIKSFREMDYSRRERIIDSYKESDYGNITLVQAPTASYFESLCESTGIIERFSRVAPNPNNKLEKTLPAIKIKPDHYEYVDFILNRKYDRAKTYDFDRNLDLWVQYIGDPSRLYPPVDCKVTNRNNFDILIAVYKDRELLFGDLAECGESIEFPAFIDEEYKIKTISPQDGKTLFEEKVYPGYDLLEFEIEVDAEYQTSELCLEDLADRIIRHARSDNYAQEILNYFEILELIDEQDRTSNAVFKGGYYEYYFYLMLKTLREEGVIDDVIWNGSLREYSIPRHAPGGRTGRPDIIFIIDSIHFVLEVTTIMSRAQQFSAEGASVPDHIRKYFNELSDVEGMGIFCAPIIFPRNRAALKAAVEESGNEVISITDEELLAILQCRDRGEIIERLLSRS